MKVKEIYKISEVVHRAAGGKIENIFLFLNTVFWALLALIVGAAGFSLATGSVIGHGITLFCIVGYTGMIIGFFGGSYYLLEVIIYIEEMRNKVSKKLSQ